MDMNFEWDPRKAPANRKKHGVSFGLARIFDDPDHSGTEAREIIAWDIPHDSGSSLSASSSEATEFGSSVPGRQRGRSGRTMKTARAPRRSKVDRGEMRREYRFDYTKARPNRSAGRFQAGAVAVVLDPDVALVFGSSNRVNRLLRSVIAAMPDRGRKRVKAGYQ
jgi:hypothetical protein